MSTVHVVFGSQGSGKSTYAKKLAARGVPQFGVMLLRVMVVMVLFVLNINQWLGRPGIDSLLFAVALAVGLSPELLPFLPLAAKQILLNNFLSDLPSITISSDRVDEERLDAAQHWDVRDLRCYMFVFGLSSTVFDLLTFWLLLKVFDTPEVQFQTSWFVVSLLTELAVLLVLRTRDPAWRSRPSTLLWVTTALVAAFALGMPFITPVAALFGMVKLPPLMLASTVLIVLGYVVATAFVKSRFHAMPPGRKRVPTRVRRRRRAHGHAF